MSSSLLFPGEEGSLFRERTFVVLGFSPEDQKQLQQFILENGGEFSGTKQNGGQFSSLVKKNGGKFSSLVQIWW